MDSSAILVVVLISGVAMFCCLSLAAGVAYQYIPGFKNFFSATTPTAAGEEGSMLMDEATSDRFGIYSSKHKSTTVECPDYIKTIGVFMDDHKGGATSSGTIGTMKVTCGNGSWQTVNADKYPDANWPKKTTCASGFTGITVYSGNEIDAVRGVCSASSNAAKVGGGGGTANNFNCPTGKKIKKLVATSGERVNSIQFACG